jgi:hypothetical protein
MSWRKASIAGSALGAVLSLLSILLLDIPEVTLLGAYALFLLLVSASLTSSPRAGALFGLFAVIGESVTDCAYFLSYGTQVLLVPYAVGFILFAGRIPVFPLAGVIGGYLGREYVAEKTRPTLRARNRAYVSRKTGERKTRERGEG